VGAKKNASYIRGGNRWYGTSFQLKKKLAQLGGVETVGKKRKVNHSLQSMVGRKI